MHNYKQQQQASPTYNAEDTSNDVSEIGTLSDMTTSEVTISVTTVESAIFGTVTAPHTTIPSSTTKTILASVISTPTAISTPGDIATATKSSTFDYLYEFSETRKVLEEFFKCPSNDDKPIENGSDVDSVVRIFYFSHIYSFFLDCCYKFVFLF